MSLLTYIAIIVVGLILSYFSPVILVFVVIGVISYAITHRNDHYDHYSDHDQGYTPPKHDAIDVEYTERDDEDQYQ